MPETISLTYQEAQPMRLDKYLAGQIAQVSRMKLQEMILGGSVQVNGKIIKKVAFKIEQGDKIEVFLELPEEAVLVEQQIELDVIHKDENVIVVNKPAGIVVHPGAGNAQNTLVNALIYHWNEIASVGEANRPGIVHRLDKETSGVMIVARNTSAYEWLVKEFKNRKPQKTYLALVDGAPPTPTGRIETRIGRDEKHRQRMSVTYGQAGRKAITEYFTRQAYKDHTLLEVNPLSGRTHQIRVHLAYLGCPVTGDTVYGRRRKTIEIERFFLHAYRLSIRLPGDSQDSEFTAPLPEDLKSVLKNLERE